MMHRSVHGGLVLGIAMLGAGCGLLGRPTLNNYERNAEYIAISRNGVAVFVEHRGTLPDSLSQICPSLDGEKCRWLPFGYRLTDVWQRPIRYRKVAGEFELRSLGPDGQQETPDDIVFRPSLESDMVSRVRGCYRLKASNGTPFVGDFVRLDTVPVGTGRYEASPSLSTTGPGDWSIVGHDSIVVKWYSIHHSRQVRFRVHDDSLVGYTAIGPGSASWGGLREPRRVVIARRAQCTA